MAQRSRLPRQVLDLQRQVVEFQKAAFDNTFNALTALQDQQQDLVLRLVEESPRVPGELKEMLEEWQEALKSGREQFRDSIDRSFETIESYLERLATETEGTGRAGEREAAPSAKGAKTAKGAAKKGAKKSGKGGAPRKGSQG